MNVEPVASLVLVLQGFKELLEAGEEECGVTAAQGRGQGWLGSAAAPHK